MPDNSIDNSKTNAGIRHLRHSGSGEPAYLDFMRCNIADKRAPVSRPARREIYCHKRWATCDIFTPEVWKLARRAGHRTHTLLHAVTPAPQRAAFFSACNKGLIAVAHNGNITNARSSGANWNRKAPFSRRRAIRK